MPASGVIDLADANLWLALVFSDHAHHGKAKAWFDAQPDGTCAFCRVTQMALLRHLTNSRIMGQFRFAIPCALDRRIPRRVGHQEPYPAGHL